MKEEIKIVIFLLFVSFLLLIGYGCGYKDGIHENRPKININIQQ
jgi:hypothetical protein